MNYYYSLKRTEDFLLSDQPRVYLYGGCPGMSNFGDIIQLKSVMHFYRNVLKIEPVIFFLTYYIESSEHVKKYYQQFDTNNIIFISSRLINARRAKLRLLRDIKSGGFMHVYGGGYLNAIWGKAHIDRISIILKDFDISDYLFSGQQIDRDILPHLEDLFNQKRPLLFGARDDESFQILKDSSVSSSLLFSFDDATEIFDMWANNSKPNLETRLISIVAKRNILLHLNFSYYSNDKTSVLALIKQIKKARPNSSIIIAQGWTDIRALRVKDGLSTLVQLKDDFPYTDYKVSNFVRMAYLIKPGKMDFPDISWLLSRTDFAISCSYHIAMLCMFFNKPVYLVSSNNFYSQKQKSLGLDIDFNDFLTNTPKDYSSLLEKKLTKRRKWIAVLEQRAALMSQSVTLSPKKINLTTADEVSRAPKLKYLSSQ